MPRTRPLYPPESVVRRCTGALGRFAQGGRGRPGHVGADAAYWRRQGDIDAGRAEGLTSDDREELRRPRRQNRWLSQEREISKGGRGFSSRGRPIAGDVLPVNRREEVTACRLPAVQRARRQPGRLLRLKGPARSRRASAATASCWTRSPRSTARATAPMAGRASMPSCVTAASVCRKRVLRLMRWAGLSGMVRRFLTNASSPGGSATVNARGRGRWRRACPDLAASRCSPPRAQCGAHYRVADDRQREGRAISSEEAQRGVDGDHRRSAAVHDLDESPCNRKSREEADRADADRTFASRSPVDDQPSLCRARYRAVLRGATRGGLRL
jgi:transposase